MSRLRKANCEDKDEVEQVVAEENAEFMRQQIVGEVANDLSEMKAIKNKSELMVSEIRSLEPPSSSKTTDQEARKKLKMDDMITRNHFVEAAKVHEIRLKLSINPSYIRALKASNELGYEPPISARVIGCRGGPTLLQKIWNGSALRAFSALCHAPTEEWNFPF
ncbi:hypothetical protein CsatB_009938 [Cannabis sativa]